MGISLSGFSQSDYQLGTKGGCNDAGLITALISILNNPSISDEYKDAYQLAWDACQDSNCRVVNYQLLCNGGSPTPSTTTRPGNDRPDPFSNDDDDDGGNGIP